MSWGWLGIYSFFLNLAGAALLVPGSTAYLEPWEERAGATVSERQGVVTWSAPGTKILWYGLFTNTGTVDCSVHLRDATGPFKLKLSAAGQSLLAEGQAQGTNPVHVPFGSFQVRSTGYQAFVLEQVAGSGNKSVQALALDGPAVESAHFNLKPRRNAASVHLSYQAQGLTNVDALYCEVTAVDDPVHTFYMACGWHRGYFGMQVNSATERRIIFSVWDSGNEAVDRAKVSDENRVRLVGKGQGVYTGDFGNEGTGGHSHLKYRWKTGETQKFLVTAQPTNQTFTVFSGYYLHPDDGRWMLISSWVAPKEGNYLRGFHSFSENFVGDNGHIRRKALYGRQWVRTADGQWHEITTARFSHDPTGRGDRLDRFMGVENGQFFLSHGGFVNGFTAFGEPFTRAASETRPMELSLPLPAPGTLRSASQGASK